MATFPTDRTYHPEHLWAQKQDDGSILVVKSMALA